METKRKRSICIFVCAGLLAGLLTGCGGEYVGRTQGDVVSGSAVSGAVVSGSAVSDSVVSEKEKTTSVEKDWLFRTDTNLYVEERHEYTDTISQRRLDGSQKKEIKIPGCTSFLGIVGNHLYYVRTDKDKKGDSCDCVCVLPIEKDPDGFDILRTDKSEELTPAGEEGHIDYYYLDPEYLIYTDRKIAEVGYVGTVIKYDIKTKKKLSETSWDNQVVSFTRCGDYFVAYDGMNEELRYQKCEDTKGKWLLLSTEGGDDGFNASLMASGQNLFFFEGCSESGEKGLYIYDLEKRENTWFVADKELLAAASEMVGQKLDLKNGGCSVTNLWYERERLYVQAELCDTRDGTYYMQYLLFSLAPGETGVQYERQMTECMQSHGTVQKGKWLAAEHYKSKKKRVAIEHAQVNDAQCYRIINGKAFFSICDIKKKKRRVGCYELESGNFKWLTKKDREYYEPCYEPQNTLYYYGMSDEYEAADQDAEDIDFFYRPFLKSYKGEEDWETESASWFVEEN